jgi:hypothetical protein
LLDFNSGHISGKMLILEDAILPVYSLSWESVAENIDEMQFEWHPRKAESNFRKHGVTFRAAATVFGDDLSITVPDPDHSFGRNDTSQLDCLHVNGF